MLAKLRMALGFLTTLPVPQPSFDALQPRRVEGWLGTSGWTDMIHCLICSQRGYGYARAISTASRKMTTPGAITAHLTQRRKTRWGGPIGV